MCLSVSTGGSVSLKTANSGTATDDSPRVLALFAVIWRTGRCFRCTLVQPSSVCYQPLVLCKTWTGHRRCLYRWWARRVVLSSHLYLLDAQDRIRLVHADHWLHLGSTGCASMSTASKAITTQQERPRNGRLQSSTRSQVRDDYSCSVAGRVRGLRTLHLYLRLCYSPRAWHSILIPHERLPERRSNTRPRVARLRR